ncbi:MAG: hypothetical protein KatS3mg039_0196 [Candidatus Kapaibacterium sp.]|nr:MAG: hypothetical protein KatS3mg039_0196 [Candidatus Kapabacteria bacterium]
MLDIVALYAELYICIYTAVAQWQQNRSLRESVLAIALIGFAFIILWALISPLARLLYRPSEQGLLIGTDSLGVLLTTAAHLTFVRFLFFSKRRRLSPLMAKRV